MALIRWRRTLALAALATALAAAPATAGLRDTYNQALAAFEEGRWQEAEGLLRESIALRTEEAKRLPLKGILRPYLPHFYLGAALAQQGDCRAALDEWRLSTEQQAITGIDLHPDLERGRNSCEQQLELLARLSASAGADLDAAGATADRLADPSREHVHGLGFESGSGSIGQRLERARTRIGEARVLLERADAEQRPELAEEALTEAGAIGRELDDALASADELAARLAAADAHKRRRIEEVRELARRVDSLLRSRSPLPPALRGRQQQLESILAGASSLREAATLEQIEALEERLLSFERQLEESEPPPPGTLRSGAIAFLRGDYPTVLDRLGEIPYRDPKARAHSLLLRSAAAFALHVSSGELDDELLDRARADALEAKLSLPDLTLAEIAFSPRFVRFYRSISPERPDAPAQGSPNGEERTR